MVLLAQLEIVSSRECLDCDLFHLSPADDRSVCLSIFIFNGDLCDKNQKCFFSLVLVRLELKDIEEDSREPQL